MFKMVLSTNCLLVFGCLKPGITKQCICRTTVYLCETVCTICHFLIDTDSRKQRHLLEYHCSYISCTLYLRFHSAYQQKP